MIKCYMCGACCTAYDISSIGKPAGVRCSLLNDDNTCSDYENRPDVCRSFRPDELCVLISSLSFEERVKVILKVYTDE